MILELVDLADLKFIFAKAYLYIGALYFLIFSLVNFTHIHPLICLFTTFYEIRYVFVLLFSNFTCITKNIATYTYIFSPIFIYLFKFMILHSLIYSSIIPLATLK
ncbi:hypothetical protein SEROH_31140 [Clostridioides difficile]